MFASLVEDTKQAYNRGDVVTKLIVINSAIFIVLNIIFIITVFSHGKLGQNPTFTAFIKWFMVPSEAGDLLTRPWTIFTYMFTHIEIGHVFWNMLYLYFFGRILRNFVTNSRILAIYVLGGLMGFLFFFLGANILPEGYSAFISGKMLGASAGVMAVVMASATMRPDYEMNLLFVGAVKLKYLAAIIIFLDLIMFSAGANSGGMIAHFGGVVLGYVFIEQLKKGNDWSVGFNRTTNNLVTFFSAPFKSEGKEKRQSPRVAYKNPNRKEKIKSRAQQRPGHRSDNGSNTNQEKVDAILDKIKASGYESLTKEEKEFLFKVSKDD